MLGPLWGLDACWCVWAGLPGQAGDAAPGGCLCGHSSAWGPSCVHHRASAAPGVRGRRHQTPPTLGKGLEDGPPLTRGAGLTHPAQPAQGFSDHCMDHPSRFRCRPHPPTPSPLGASVAHCMDHPSDSGCRPPHPPAPSFSRAAPLSCPLTHLSAPVHGPPWGIPSQTSPPIRTLGSSAATWSMEHPPCAQTSSHPISGS